jgi:mono/diheme cytochrome c family protein
MLLRALPVAIVLCASSVAALGQTPATLARGKEIAERACGGCHAIDQGKAGTVGGKELASLRAIAGRPGQTPQRLQAFILTPHRPMPGIPLSLAEVDAIVAYVLSLK